MGEVFRASESVASGAISRGRLRWNYRPIFPDVHVPSGHQVSLRTRTVGAWLWSKRKAVITGRAAAALHGALWVNESSPIELLTSNNRPPSGIITRTERIARDEVLERHGMAVATPQRTAFDLGRFLPETPRSHTWTRSPAPPESPQMTCCRWLFVTKGRAVCGGSRLPST